MLIVSCLTGPVIILTFFANTARSVNYLGAATCKIVISPLVISVQDISEQHSALAQHCAYEPLCTGPKH